MRWGLRGAHQSSVRIRQITSAPHAIAAQSLSLEDASLDGVPDWALDLLLRLAGGEKVHQLSVAAHRRDVLACAARLRHLRRLDVRAAGGASDYYKATHHLDAAALRALHQHPRLQHVALGACLHLRPEAHGARGGNGGRGSSVPLRSSVSTTLEPRSPYVAAAPGGGGDPARQQQRSWRSLTLEHGCHLPDLPRLPPELLQGGELVVRGALSLGCSRQPHHRHWQGACDGLQALRALRAQGRLRLAEDDSPAHAARRQWCLEPSERLFWVQADSGADLRALPDLARLLLDVGLGGGAGQLVMGLEAYRPEPHVVRQLVEALEGSGRYSGAHPAAEAAADQEAGEGDASGGQPPPPRPAAGALCMELEAFEGVFGALAALPRSVAHLRLRCPMWDGVDGGSGVSASGDGGEEEKGTEAGQAGCPALEHSDKAKLQQAPSGRGRAVSLEQRLLRLLRDSRAGEDQPGGARSVVALECLMVLLASPRQLLVKGEPAHLAHTLQRAAAAEGMAVHVVVVAVAPA